MSQGTVIAAPRPAPAATATWVGLFLSLFSMLLIRQVFLSFTSNTGTGLALLKEGLIWTSAASVLWLARRGERLPLQSIGIGTSPWWKSLLWGLATAAACLAVAGTLAHLTHYGSATSYLDKLPVSVVTLIVLRAGVVEELFYRGFAIERLQAVGLSRAAAVAIPLAIFAVGHWTGGAANILIALVLGGILTAFYLWRRDLVANMIGHFLVDFLANVLPRLVG
jgi:membrane protease YdiL (CAAX protease family)